jgi:RNA polymerase sigma factor (sigma-70 family)
MATGSPHPLLNYIRRLRRGRAGESALDDVELLHRFLTQRDQSAFAILMQRYGAMVWGLCVRRLGETPEAEDAFQATFLVLVRKAASLRGPQLLGPWLYGVAYRTALRLRGQRARRTVREVSLPEQIAEERPEPKWSELRPVLDEEIQRLPTKYRLPVLLCYLQGLSSEEAAQRLGCAKGTVFSRLSRARALLRRRLVRRGVDVSVGALTVMLAENETMRAAPSLALREMTVRTSLLFAAGTAGQSLSAPLAALVDGVVRSMILSKVKFAVVIVLALGIAGAGAGILGFHSEAEQPTSKQLSKPATAAPEGVAVKTKAKNDESKPYVPPPAVVGETQALLTMRDKLAQPVDYPGLDDANATLIDVLDMVSKRYNIAYLINERAFRYESRINLIDSDAAEGVQRAKIAEDIPVPAMKTRLRTVLQTILSHVNLESPHSEVMFLVRKDHIEITTSRFVRMELGFSNVRPIPPLVWDSFEEVSLAQILPRLAETSGYNLVADPKAGEKLQTKLTMQLNNVPIDTAVRLLANMAGLSVVRLDNVFYVTTAENAKQLREEQAKINPEIPVIGAAVPKKPVPDKGAK